MRWTWLFLLSVPLSYASPVPSRAISTNEDQTNVILSDLSPEELFGPDLGTRSERDKRKLSWILDLIFWKVNKIFEFKTWVLSGFSSRPKKQPSSIKGVSTAEPPIEFEGDRVSLVLPDELFGSAFTVITDVSKIIGSVIQNSARRTKTLLDTLKPILRNALGIRSSTSAVLESKES